MIKNYVGIFKDFLYVTKKRKKSMILFLIFSSALYHISSLLPAIATAGIIAMISISDMNYVFVYALLYIAFYAFNFMTLYWVHYCYTKLEECYYLEIQKDLFEKVAQTDDILKKASKGKILDICNNDVCYIVNVIYSFIEIIMNIVKSLVILYIFMTYNILVGLFVIFLELLYLLLMDKNSSNISKYHEGQRKYTDKLIDTLSQIMDNLKQIRILNVMPNLNNKLEQTRNKWSEQYIKKRHYITKRYSVIPSIIYLGKIIIYVALAYLVVNNMMTLDKLILLVAYFEIIVSSTDIMLEHLLNLNNYKFIMKRIRMILSYNETKGIDFGDLDNDYLSGAIEFKNVTYEVGDKKILDNVSFKLYPNEINAIVGHSGAGKTSVFNLLYRLKKVTSGTILIDNENIYDYTKNVYFSNVSGVYQKPFIFEMSIKDNLSLVDPNIDNQIAACKRVGIHEKIMQLPKGYNTIIDEEETKLSLGEKQLLVIARALLSNAEILLFDEVTGNIDTNMTAHIANLLLDLKTDHTVVLITHKPEMIDVADRVVVLDKGVIEAKGKKANVYAKSKLFKELISRTFVSASKEID